MNGMDLKFVKAKIGSTRVIELDDGKNLTGNPYIFDGKNHGFL